MTLAHSRVRIGTHAVRDRQPGVVRPAAEQPELARRTPVALAHPRVAIATRPPAAAEPRPVDATAAVARDRSALGRLTPNVPIADGKERCGVGVEARVEPRIHPRIDARVHPPASRAASTATAASRSWAEEQPAISITSPAVAPHLRRPLPRCEGRATTSPSAEQTPGAARSDGARGSRRQRRPLRPSQG